MSETTLAKGYEPAEVEARWTDFWRETGAGTADPNAPGEPYSIVIPPPNVTGALHMGHALNLTLQDILCRHMRQMGRKVLWVPGTDHAGIATQNVVERKLAGEGVSRHDIGREKFIERVWEWRAEYGGRILSQIRRMGASVDWTRERFTMDEGLSRAVREVFVRLYDEGLIYKGDYIINWCPRCQTALADLEVEHSAKQGALYHIRYPLADGSGEVIVATTRPETMLGDTAVAVHPEDERYAGLVGKSVTLPLAGRTIPIIADAYVDREFGTGCLKVTPAHDMNDFELGRRHNLPVMKVMDGQGLMNELAGPAYQGLTREECRKKVVADLEAGGFLVRKEDHEHNVGECYRCKTVVEPYVSPQWFVKAGPLAAVARKAVEDGRTVIYPEHWTTTYYHWLDNIRDWCISRQIWWGHRIPAWTCQACGKLIVSKTDPDRCPCGGELVQDPDVLDTWFSSALWPFSTLGWPDKTPELATFYPTSVLVTGFDILFFWVARMMMMGLHFMDEVPFRHVYIHALVRDGEGKKMSKSTGNAIDPVEIIGKYGTDALRFTLTAFAAMGRDIKLAEERIEGYRHFVNKLWNAARFSLMNLPEQGRPQADLTGELPLHHAWILTRLEEMKEETAKAVEEYRFNDVAQGLYSFLWLEFCDWYLEMVKPDISSDDPRTRDVAQTCLWTVLSELLVLLHPVIPFVTQEIWSNLPGHDEKDISRALYPEARPHHRHPDAKRRMALLQDVVVSVRNIRSELSINPGYKLECLVRTSSAEDLAVLKESAGLIAVLAKLAGFTAGPDVTAPKASASAAAGGNAVFVPLAGAVDFDAELARLNKELTKTSKEAQIVARKLANEDFTSKAPAEVVAKEREKDQTLRDKVAKLEELKTRIESLKG
ncbi:valine--tRNA ligase [Fundidesulfovibrio butyratiphilus]